MTNFFKVWFCVFLSLCYCYALGKIVRQGIPRLLAVLPVVCLFLALPLNLVSANLGGLTAFFVAWLANFKLLLFAFGKGPLCSDLSVSLGSFVAVSCLPIKIQQKPPQKPVEEFQNGHGSREIRRPKGGRKSFPNYAIKGLILALLLRAYDFNDKLNGKVVLALYSLHIYLSLEIILALVASFSRALLGVELEPQFDEPYLSASLQDFWGRRWNIMVSSILRPAVYEPALKLATTATGRRWAPLPAVMATFAVSAVMHELMFFYLGRVRPTWEITWFFVLHGACLVAEIALKKSLTGRFWLPRFVSGPLTVGFVMVTAFWLFFPQLLRCNGDVRAFEEYAAVGAFVKRVVGGGFTWQTVMNSTRSLST